MVVGLAVVWSSGVMLAQQPAPESVNGITWRLTRHGWQDISTTFSTAGPPAPGIESIHPALWALWILAAVLLTLLWSSSEWEYSRLAKASPAKASPAKASPAKASPDRIQR